MPLRIRDFYLKIEPILHRPSVTYAFRFLLNKAMLNLPILPFSLPIYICIISYYSLLISHCSSNIELMKSTVTTGPKSTTASSNTAATNSATTSPEEASDDIGDKVLRDEVEPKPVLFMRLPSDAILLAKHYDLKSLSR